MSTAAPTAHRTILVIDDEPHIRRFLQISLRAQGHQVLLAEDGMSGLDLLRDRSVDLVILDIGLPDIDGHAVLSRLRAFTQVPVIMLTVRSGEGDKVAALDAGAHDYVTKPFGINELMARIRVLLRSRGEGADSEQPLYFDDGHLRIDEANHLVHCDGEAVPLSRKEFALLVLLARSAGRLVTQPTILARIWGSTHDQDAHYVRILLGRLRPKIGDNATSPRYIQTIPGVGLQFIGQSSLAAPPTSAGPP